MVDKWEKVLRILSGKLTKTAYNQHFKNTKAELNSANQLIIYTAKKLTSKALQQPGLMNVLKQVVTTVYGDNITIAVQEIAIDLPDPQPEQDTLPSVPQSTFETTGFTPVVDSLAQEIGLIPAAIYGVVWRYCQMNSRTCYAEQKTIASRLGLSRKCVNENIKKLLNGGYIRCLNDNQSGATRVYIVTNKVAIKAGFSIEASVNGQV